jgi:hypothetical protein
MAWSVEVVVGEVVAHAGDLAPRHFGDLGEEVGDDALDRFSDFDEADSHCVVDEPSVRSPRIRCILIASMTRRCR